MSNTQVIPKINVSNITSYAAVGAIVSANGNMRLAAENFNTTEDVLISLVSADRGAAELLQEQLRTRVILRTYQSFTSLNDFIFENLELFEAKELTKMFNTLNMVLAEYLKTPGNSIKDIMTALPEEVRGHLINLL